VTPPGRRERALWLRPALFAVFAASLPLAWREASPTSCSGTPLGPTATEHGWHLLFHELEPALIVAFLVVCALVLTFVVARARVVVQIIGHLVAAVASAMLFFVGLFAATFSLFTPIRLREGAYFGLTALALAAVEALTRAGLAFARWLHERATQVDADDGVP
jgi:hypothetical protein